MDMSIFSEFHKKRQFEGAGGGRSPQMWHCTQLMQLQGRASGKPRLPMPETEQHQKEIIKEGFLEETQELGMHKTGSENSAIWAFLCTRYWNELCVDLALILDHFELVGTINVPKTTDEN